jgi:hypothetical protein
MYIPFWEKYGEAPSLGAPKLLSLGLRVSRRCYSSMDVYENRGVVGIGFFAGVALIANTLHSLFAFLRQLPALFNLTYNYNYRNILPPVSLMILATLSALILPGSFVFSFMSFIFIFYFRYIFALKYKLDFFNLYVLFNGIQILYKKIFIDSSKMFEKAPKVFFIIFSPFIYYVLLLRSIFYQKEYPWLAYVPMVFFLTNLIAISQYNFPLFTLKAYTIFLVILGFHLVLVDAQGDAIAFLYYTYPLSLFSISLSTSLTRLQKSNHMFVRFTGTRAIAGIFFGKSGLTPTGKASIFAGAVAAGSFTVNEYLDRVHDAKQQELTRAHDAKQQELTRAHDTEQQVLQRKHDATQQELNRDLEKAKLDLEKAKLDFQKQKYSDAQIASAKASWWSRSK